MNQAVLKHLHPEHVEGEIWAVEYRAAPGSVAVRGAARRPLVGLPAWGDTVRWPVTWRASGGRASTRVRCANVVWFGLAKNKMKNENILIIEAGRTEKIIGPIFGGTGNCFIF